MVIIYLGPFFQSLAVLTLIVIVMADDGDFRAESRVRVVLPEPVPPAIPIRMVLMRNLPFHIK